MKPKLFILLFILALTAPVLGQQAKPEEKSVKLALINSAFFDDEENGIADYVRAFKTLGVEFFAPNRDRTLKRSIETLEKQLQDSSLTLLERKLKEQELSAKKQKYEQIEKDYNEAFERRYVALVAPIQVDIAKEIDKIGKQNNIVFLDASKDYKGFILWVDEKTDFTSQFIDYYNNRKLTNADFVVKTEIPEIRIARIDNELLANEKEGLKRLAIENKKFAQEFEKAYPNYKNYTEEEKKAFRVGYTTLGNELYMFHKLIEKEIALFAQEKSYVFVFQHTRSDIVLNSSIIPDITKEFIAYFNERYP